MPESVESEESWVVGSVKRALESGLVEYACEVYEESGVPEADALLTALRNSPARIAMAGAQMFVQARDFARAGRLFEHTAHWADAAAQYEAAGDAAAAGKAWQRAGDLQRAAQQYDAAGNIDAAIGLYQKLGDKASAARCLLQKGRGLEAAKLYRELGNVRGEMDALRAVRGASPDRPAAVKRLAEMLAFRNRPAEAIQVLVEAIRESELVRNDRALHEQVAVLYEKVGQPENAARVREHLAETTAEAAPLPRPAAQPAGQPAPRPTAPRPPMPQIAVRAPDTSAAATQITSVKDGYGFLKAIPLFAKLSIDDMKDLYRLTTEVTFDSGETIIEQGSDGRGLFVVLSGKLEIVAVLPTGATKKLNALGAGAYVGEVSLLGKSKTSARVAAMEKVQALHIQPEQFEKFLASRPGAALRVYRLFAENLADRVRALSAR